MGLVWSGADPPSPNSRICCEGGCGVHTQLLPTEGGRGFRTALARGPASLWCAGPQGSRRAGAGAREQPQGWRIARGRAIWLRDAQPCSARAPEGRAVGSRASWECEAVCSQQLWPN